jgi:hypothetical protein
VYVCLCHCQVARARGSLPPPPPRTSRASTSIALPPGSLPPARLVPPLKGRPTYLAALLGGGSGVLPSPERASLAAGGPVAPHAPRAPSPPWADRGAGHWHTLDMSAAAKVPERPQCAGFVDCMLTGRRCAFYLWHHDVCFASKFADYSTIHSMTQHDSICSLSRRHLDEAIKRVDPQRGNVRGSEVLSIERERNRAHMDALVCFGAGRHKVLCWHHQCALCSV